MTSTSPFKLLRVGVPSPSRLGHVFPPYDLASAREAGKLLDHNHLTYHIFFNDSGFHNHLSHHVLAAHALGARPAAYAGIYEHAKQDLSEDWKLNKKPTPGEGGIEKITRENWEKHLGDRLHYWPFLEFWDQETRALGLGPTLERYVLSDEANRGNNRMLGRLIGGAVHPLIHVGYGAEFDLPGIMAEGLSMAAITKPAWHNLLPEGWHDEIGVKEGISVKSTADRLAKLSVQDGEHASHAAADGATASHPRSGLSVFSICAQAYADDRLAPGALIRYDMKDKFDALLLSKEGPALINEHTSKWHITAADVADPDPITGRGGWNEPFEQLVWLNTLMLGATTRPGHKPRHDFFYLHSHNAVLFLPSLLPLLSPSGRSKLLHATWRVTFAIWIARGRAAFHINETLNQYPENPLDPHKKFSYEGDKDGKPLADERRERDAWYDIAEAASQHGDEHAMKALRTQIEFGRRFAGAEKGSIRLQDGVKDTGGAFRGLDQLDGTAFKRTAGQLLESQGWRHHGGFEWDFNGPGFDETWAEDAVKGRM